MTAVTNPALVIAAYIAGVSVSIIFPYIVEYLKTGVAFDWRLVSSRIASALVGLLPVVLSAQFVADLLAQVDALGFAGQVWIIYLGIFMIGWGVSQAGRDVSKTATISAHRRSR